MTLSKELQHLRKFRRYENQMDTIEKTTKDGITLIPWLCGKPVLWVTCTDTLAKSYVELSSKKAGEAARLRENAKKSKYVTVETYYYC
jgi:hypothetical protein